MSVLRSPQALKFGAFAVVMVVLSAFLIVVFGDFRTGSTNSYSARFAEVSELRSGDTVRVAGVRVGTVEDVSLRADHDVTVTFNADRDVRLTDGTHASVKYLNLVGDRYLELSDGVGTTRILGPGAEIPENQTSPALDLDVLLGGLKPVIDGLRPQEVNGLTSSLLQIMQGQEGTVESLFSKTSSFVSTLADNGVVIENLIDNLNTVMGTLSDKGPEFSTTIERLDRLIGELAEQRDPIGSAIAALDSGTAAVADLLTQARPSLAQSVDELARLAPLVDDDKGRLDAALQNAPVNFRKLVRTGTYGNFIQYFICAITVRVTDAAGEVVVLPWIEQTTGRCSP
ncbi:MCE family protein [Williamsia sp.]|uniref:MCE family protein n=1 Tax=Williamsia sp. TaxID=1872085 RepID=UPI002F9420AF